MELYFLRHGDAEVALFNTPRADFESGLSEIGAEDVLKGALAMKMFITKFDIIFTSPLKRAVQTATIYGKVFKCTDRIKKLDALMPPGNLRALLETIAFQGNFERVLCVGHEPSLGIMATEILTGIEEENMFPLKKAGIMCIEMKKPQIDAESELLYLVHPMFLAKIGEVPFKSAMYAGFLDTSHDIEPESQQSGTGDMDEADAPSLEDLQL
ncbi:MAG: histidine phosphatase family protein [Firmicutes bacterium]|nr:histidine phosphatase family protein [Bacillota bacterium]